MFKNVSLCQWFIAWQHNYVFEGVSFYGITETFSFNWVKLLCLMINLDNLILLITLPKFLDANCGPKNLAPIVVKIWAGLNAISGSGRTPPVALAAVAWWAVVELANCPGPDQKPGIVPGFLDPQIRLFCPRGGAPDYQSRGRATGHFLRQPLSQRPEFSIVNLYSVR